MKGSFHKKLRQFSRSWVWLAASHLFWQAERIANGRSCRIIARSSAVGMISMVTAYGLLAGDHLGDPSSGERSVPARISSWLGYAAEDIRINGLQRMDAAAVMKAIGVKPGGSLVGFDAPTARSTLLNLDWVKTAKVRVLPANRLEVDITEREPFAIWQRDGLYYVIDREGSAIASFDARKYPGLLLVSGDGAQSEVSLLVNQLEAWPEIHSKVKSAARVGNRRWTLYFEQGRQVMLPEKRVETALAVLADMEKRAGILSSGIEVTDLRIEGSAALVPFESVNDEASKKLASNTR